MEALTTPARRYVDGLDRALGAPRELTGHDVRTRLRHGDAKVASIGGFLLVTGTEQAHAPFRDVQSTVLVDDRDGLHHS